MNVEISHERRRGCGFRNAGKTGVGIYLCGPGNFVPCERIPFPLRSCPTCGGGIRFSRGFTWIQPHKLFSPDQEPLCLFLRGMEHCPACAMCSPGMVAGKRAGLMWVGEKFYSPDSFIREAMSMGISKKIPAIPRGFDVGEHWIYLAHVSAVCEGGQPSVDGEREYSPGVFTAFRPSYVDLVIDDQNNIPERAARLAEKLGDKAHLLQVVSVDEQPDLPMPTDDAMEEPMYESGSEECL